MSHVKTHEQFSDYLKIITNHATQTNVEIKRQIEKQDRLLTPKLFKDNYFKKKSLSFLLNESSWTV